MAMVSEVGRGSPPGEGAGPDPGCSCPACGRGPARRWGVKNGCPLYRCRPCGSVFASPDPHEAPVPGPYDYGCYYEHARFENPPMVAASLGRLVAWAERFRRTGRWLDIAYGEGGLLDIAEAHGWLCSGTEVSPQTIEYGERRGWVVGVRTAGDGRFPAGGFDVVTMIEVLEHVREPRALLGEAGGLVRPGGLLYITTPNAHSLNRWLLGRDWSIFSPPEHLTIWTARGLRQALAAGGGFEARIRTEGFNPVELWQRLRRPAGDGEPLDRNAAARALSATLAKGPLRRALKGAVNAGLNALCVGDTLKAIAVRREGAS